MRVGIAIKSMREEMGMTQSELAEGICSIQHLYRIENSKRLPSGYLVYELNKKMNNRLIDVIYSDECL